MTAVILAGGRSRRVGENKLFLKWGRHTLIAHAVASLSPLFEDMLIVANRENVGALLELFPSYPRIVHDIVEGKGPLGGIHAGLISAKSPAAFVVGCDMPLLNPKLVSFLKGLSEGYDAVVPRTPKGLEPLHSIYTKNCLPAIVRQLGESDLRPNAVLSRLNVRYVEPEEMTAFDPELLSFANINTLKDYRNLAGQFAPADCQIYSARSGLDPGWK
ncbi:MAG: molybdenum cofactor guanylyltransferase [Candidatus Aminicenantales bacterium]